MIENDCCGTVRMGSPVGSYIDLWYLEIWKIDVKFGSAYFTIQI